MTTMAYVWLALVVIFSIAEGATAGLVSLWFVGGAVIAFFAALLGASVLVQFVIFILVSAVLLACLRPLARKRLSVKPEATNADRIIGRAAIVTERIDNLRETGAIKISGVEWTARSQDENPIPADTHVRILRIDGVKVYVEPLPLPVEV